MTDLSDFKRIIHEPMERELRLARSELQAERNRREQLETALQTIQSWDCLNPPAIYLCADFPWLKQLVDDALDGGTAT